MADVNVRRLVQDASSVRLGGGESTRRTHKLGHRISKDTKFQHTHGLVYLPAAGNGYERLRAAIEMPVLDLPPELNGSAWRALLRPGSALVLPTPELEQLLREDIAVPERRTSDVRRFALAAVLDPGEALSANGLHIDRFAGGAVLTVLADPSRPKAPTDAWITVEWKNSTASLGSWLARQLDAAGPAAIARARRTPVAVLIDPSRTALFDLDSVAKVTLAGAAFGLDVRVLDFGKSNFGAMHESLTREEPSILMMFGPPDGSSTSLIEGYRARTGRTVLHTDTPDRDDMAHVLREGFAQVTGLSASLRLLDAEQPTLSDEARPRPPVADPRECRHDDANRYYLLDGATALWWTPDTAGHAGTVFKTYRRSGASLIHQACRDGDGYVIDKFKGAVGDTVQLVDLHGCEDPTRHL